MKRFSIWLAVVSIVISGIFPSKFVFAETPPETPKNDLITEIVDAKPGDVLITQFKIGNKTQDRFVEIFNNTDKAVDVTDWCVWYHATEINFASTSKRACLPTTDKLTRLVLPAKTHKALMQADFSDGFGSGDKGRLFIANSSKQVIDSVSWNINPDQTEPFILPAKGQYIIGRKTTDYINYQNTNKNNYDFKFTDLKQSYETGSIIEVADQCSNLLGIQQQIPAGFVLADGANCIEEKAIIDCQNFPGISLMDAGNLGYEIDNQRNCYEDKCTNIEEFQETVTGGYYMIGNHCESEIMPLQVTELLPNPNGIDKGGEFIEIYNPNDIIVDLSKWGFSLNGDQQKIYRFPVGSVIEPAGYFVLYSSSVNFSLTNTSGSLTLKSLDGHYAVEVPAWHDAKDGQAWSLLEGSWRYLSPASPGMANYLVADSDESEELIQDCGVGRERNPLTGRCRNIPIEATILPCRDNQYRSEETGRCRNIVVDKPLVACKDGQYRSEETGRCRSIASVAVAALKPCEDGQFRNPETNRCKKIASTEDTLQPCPEDFERNPATNRCRKVKIASATTADYPVEIVKDSAKSFVAWWALGGVILAGLSIAGWEWRKEIRQFFRPKLSKADK